MPCLKAVIIRHTLPNHVMKPSARAIYPSSPIDQSPCWAPPVVEMAGCPDLGTALPRTVPSLPPSVGGTCCRASVYLLGRPCRAASRSLTTPFRCCDQLGHGREPIYPHTSGIRAVFGRTQPQAWCCHYGTFSRDNWPSVGAAGPNSNPRHTMTHMAHHPSAIARPLLSGQPLCQGSLAAPTFFARLAAVCPQLCPHHQVVERRPTGALR